MLWIRVGPSQGFEILWKFCKIGSEIGLRIALSASNRAFEDQRPSETEWRNERNPYRKDPLPHSQCMTPHDEAHHLEHYTT